nr:proline-rich protein 36-like [Peromyscus maniculatus bairdii]
MKNLAFAWLEPPGEKAFSSLHTPPPADPALTCPTPWSYPVCLHSPCSVYEIHSALPSTQPPACLILPPNGLLSGPALGASEQEGHLPGAPSALWAWASSHLSLLVLPSQLPQLPPSQLPPSQLPLHGLSLVYRSLPFLSRSPWPTLHLLLPSLPCLPSLNLSPYLLRPLLKPACDLLPPLTLPALPLFQFPGLSEELPPGLR